MSAADRGDEWTQCFSSTVLEHARTRSANALPVCRAVVCTCIASGHGERVRTGVGAALAARWAGAVLRVGVGRNNWERIKGEKKTTFRWF